MKKNIESNIFFEVQKYYFVFESMLIFFFQMVISTTLFQRSPTLWKSTLKMTTSLRRCPTLFSSMLKNTTLFQRCSTLNLHVDIHNVVSTLIWRCATSRCHINLKTTLNRRWNVCWESILSRYQCGLRKGFSVLTTLLPMIEKWRESLDSGGNFGALLTDRSKAFECLPHVLLIAKLHAYRLDMASLKFLHYYLTKRRQRVKINNTYSS